MDRNETTKTLNVLSLALLVAYGIFGKSWLIWLGFLLLMGAVLETRMTDALARYWMKLASFLGRINTAILLSVIFTLVLIPVSLAYRWLNRQASDRFLRNGRESYWENVNRTYEKSDFLKSW